MVVLDRDGRTLAALFGVVPLAEAPEQVARDGEDFAILMLSRRAVLGPNVSLFVDCAATVGCLRHPRGACAPGSARAHWWAEIGDRLEGVQVF